MHSHGWSLGTRGVWVAIAVAALSTLRAGTAEAQARGTLQVYAQVVDTKVSSEALQAASAVVKGQPSAVSTVAQVSLSYPADPRATAVVVTIDYSKN